MTVLFELRTATSLFPVTVHYTVTRLYGSVHCLQRSLFLRQPRGIGTGVLVLVDWTMTTSPFQLLEKPTTTSLSWAPLNETRLGGWNSVICLTTWAYASMPIAWLMKSFSAILPSLTAKSETSDLSGIFPSFV